MTSDRRIGKRTGTLVLFVSFCLAAPALGAQRIKLPSSEQIIRRELRAEQLLRGGLGPERTLPGRVEDREEIVAELTPDGRLVAVKARQFLRLHGVGDYFFRIPGPVSDVTTLPPSTAPAGLRAGSVVWQGFSNGREDLAAELDLVPDQERDRLPLDVSIDFLEEDGEVRLTLRLRNRTAVPVELATATGDPTELGNALRRAESLILRGRRPQPGKGGIPSSIRARTRPRTSVARIAAPMSFAVEVVLPADARVVGGTGVDISRKADGVHVRWSGLLSGSDLSEETTVNAQVASLELPDVTVSAKPSLPLALAARATGDAAEMFTRLMRLTAQIAQLHVVDGYVGNPDALGPTETSYRWILVSQPEPAKPSTSGGSPAPTPPSLLAIFSTSAVALLVLILAGWVWARS